MNKNTQDNFDDNNNDVGEVDVVGDNNDVGEVDVVDDNEDEGDDNDEDDDNNEGDDDEGDDEGDENDDEGDDNIEGEKNADIEDDIDDNEVDIDVDNNIDGNDNDNKNDDNITDFENDAISFHDDLRKSYINKYHPELKNIPYGEMDTLTKVIRNTFGNVIDPLHKTLPILTKFERTKILGLRSYQLDNGSEPLVEIPDNDTFIPSYIIAEKELNSNKLGFFIIMRPLPNGKREYWKLDDLDIVDL